MLVLHWPFPALVLLYHPQEVAEVLKDIFSVSIRDVNEWKNLEQPLEEAG